MSKKISWQEIAISATVSLAVSGLVAGAIAPTAAYFYGKIAAEQRLEEERRDRRKTAVQVFREYIRTSVLHFIGDLSTTPETLAFISIGRLTPMFATGTVPIGTRLIENMLIEFDESAAVVAAALRRIELMAAVDNRILRLNTEAYEARMAKPNKSFSHLLPHVEGTIRFKTRVGAQSMVLLYAALHAVRAEGFLYRDGTAHSHDEMARVWQAIAQALEKTAHTDASKHAVAERAQVTVNTGVEAIAEMLQIGTERVPGLLPVLLAPEQ